jgi:MFS transporter, AAHS family, 3-hydroxyphenylpropionic acid transporter
MITTWLCFLIATFEGFDLQAAGVAAPRLGPVFRMTPEQFGGFFSSSTLGLMIGAAIGGRLSDRVGRKTVLTASIAVFGLMSVLTGMSNSVDMLLLMRFLTGVGMGGALPNLIALANENAPPGKKNFSVGLLFAGMPAGGALASLTATFGDDQAWQTVFYVGGVAPIVAIPLLLWKLPESAQLSQARHQAVSPGSGSRSGYVFALFGDGRAPRTLLLWSSFFFTLLTLYLLLNWLPRLLEARGLDRTETFYVQMVFNVFGAIACVATGFLMDRLGLSKVIVASFVLTAASLYVLSDVAPALGTALLIGSLMGATMLSAQAILYAVTPNNYPTEVRGTGVGAGVTVGRLGSTAGPLLASALLASGRTVEQVLLVLVPVILFAGAAALALAGVMHRQEVRHA